MILDAVFNEQGVELPAAFENKIELNYIIAKSISISKRYAVSASSVVAPTSWSEEAQTVTSANPYLWMKTLTSYVAVDGSVFNFEDGGIVVGVHGGKGETGANAVTFYIESDSGTALKIGESTTLTARIYGGTEEIDPSGKLSYVWYKRVDGGSYASFAEGKTITVNERDYIRNMDVYFECVSDTDLGESGNAGMALPSAEGVGF